MQVHNFFTGDGELVNSCERAKKIVDEMFLPRRGERLSGSRCSWHALHQLAGKQDLEASSNFSFLPDGQLFPCRRKALELLIKEGAGGEEVAKMQTGLKRCN